MQTRFEYLEEQGSGLVYEKLMSMQRDLYKTTPLRAGMYEEVPNNNQAIMKTKNNDLFW